MALCAKLSHMLCLTFASRHNNNNKHLQQRTIRKYQLEVTQHFCNILADPEFSARCYLRSFQFSTALGHRPKLVFPILLSNQKKEHFSSYDREL